MKLFEKIKTMNIDEMETFLKQEQCRECPYQPNWHECEQLDCWVKGADIRTRLECEVIDETKEH